MQKRLETHLIGQWVVFGRNLCQLLLPRKLLLLQQRHLALPLCTLALRRRRCLFFRLYDLGGSSGGSPLEHLCIAAARMIGISAMIIKNPIMIMNSVQMKNNNMANDSR